MFRLGILFESTPLLAKFLKWSPNEVEQKMQTVPLQLQGPQCIVS